LDLATSIAPDLKQKIVGIRPGEKLNEIMCPSDDSHLTIEFEDHYTITPTINFHSKDLNYFKNHIGEKGTKVKLGFEYNSGNNHHFLTVNQLIELNKNIFNDV
jgi:UDP-N-acetylglucosamine 4,6-dehydratase